MALILNLVLKKLHSWGMSFLKANCLLFDLSYLLQYWSILTFRKYVLQYVHHYSNIVCKRFKSALLGFS